MIHSADMKHHTSSRRDYALAWTQPSSFYASCTSTVIMCQVSGATRSHRSPSRSVGSVSNDSFSRHEASHVVAEGLRTRMDAAVKLLRIVYIDGDYVPGEWCNKEPSLTIKI